MKTFVPRVRSIQNRCGLFLFAFLVALPFCSPIALAQAPGQRPTINITAYSIDAELDPDAHTLKATAKVTFTALQPIDTAVFQLHSALKVDKVTDGSNAVLSGERGTDASIRLTLPSPMSKGQTTTFTFEYGGVLSGSEESPVEGLKLASIGSPISYLLYPARWFPMSGYLTDRFTADIHVTVPDGIPGRRQRQRRSHADPVNPAELSSSTGPSPAFPGPSSRASFLTPRCPVSPALPTCISGPLMHIRQTAPEFGRYCRRKQFELLHRDLRPCRISQIERSRAPRRYRSGLLGS